MQVFVLDKNGKPLDPCHPARARKLLDRGKAAVFQAFPFTIILKDRTLEDSVVHEHRVKIDPGSKATGLVVVREETGQVVFAAEIEHRGLAVKASLESRSGIRRGRRQRNARYRQQRFDNRTRPKGWLPPSLESRLGNVLTWVKRLIDRVPVGALSQELIRFDMQLMENAEISGVEYQQGTLSGYEAREYLLEKWGRKCAYCGKEGVPLQIEHIVARVNHGTDRISNLALACEPCNVRKGARTIEDFLRGKPERLAAILRQAKAPLADAAAVNATRWELFRRLEAISLPVESGSGGRTKFNRTQQGFPKAHWIDAACVGESGEHVGLDPAQAILAAKANGFGNRQACGTDKFGFPFRWRSRVKKVHGFQTGDIVRAEVPKGKNAGSHVGRVAVRSTGSFRIGSIDGINVRHVRMVQRVNGYQYLYGGSRLLPMP